MSRLRGIVVRSRGMEAIQALILTAGCFLVCFGIYTACNTSIKNTFTTAMNGIVNLNWNTGVAGNGN